MRTTIAATLLAAMPLFSQYENPRISSEERHAQLRADYSRPMTIPQDPGSTRSSRPSAEDCLASAQRTAGDPKPGGPVSYYKLTHKIPTKARKEFQKGVAASLAGDHDTAEVHYRNAIRIDPGYLEAHNNLGARVMIRGQWKEAMEELEIANRLDPSSSSVHANLGVVYLELGDFKKAEGVGRLASTLDPEACKAHYVVGMAMLRQSKDVRIAKEHLIKASEEVPGVLTIIAKLGL